ncbi:MAG: hypothetical protein ACI89L_000138 [Phycisphaerales bacterium]|jgi:hypothetical protein
MSLDKTVVIELGAPSGLDSTGLSRLASCLHQRVMAGQRVVAVVSPPMWRGVKDLEASERLGAAADGHARAMLVGSGAIDTAQRLAGILADRGVRVARVNAEKTAVVTRGHPLDAQPRHASARFFATALQRADIVIVPAGVGVDDYGRATHLGENAGALTALFLADAFGLPVELSQSLGGSSIGARKARLFARDRGILYAVDDASRSVGAKPGVSAGWGQRRRVVSHPSGDSPRIGTDLSGENRMAASA